MAVRRGKDSDYLSSCVARTTKARVARNTQTRLMPKKTQRKSFENYVIAVSITEIHFWMRSLRKNGPNGGKGIP